jgi:hypothetical protein
VVVVAVVVAIEAPLLVSQHQEVKVWPRAAMLAKMVKTKLVTVVAVVAAVADMVVAMVDPSVLAIKVRWLAQAAALILLLVTPKWPQDRTLQVQRFPTITETEVEAATAVVVQQPLDMLCWNLTSAGCLFTMLANLPELLHMSELVIYGKVSVQLISNKMEFGNR